MRKGLMTVPGFLVLVATIASCSASGADQPGTPDAAETAVRAPASIPMFLNLFREAFPDLANGRTDKGISNDAINTCHDHAQGEPEDVILRRVAARFERNGTTPDTAMATGILNLIKATACGAPPTQ